MRNLAITIPIGLGDLIYIKAALDSIKNQFSQIKINFNKNIIKSVGRDLEYCQFLDEIGQLFFTEAPYSLDDTTHTFCEYIRLYMDNKISPCKPELGHLLCKGVSLQIDGEYIVLTTKTRYFSRDIFDRHAQELWNTIKSLSKKYKIVILGEREVQMNIEYQYHGDKYIYSIYDDIKKNVDHNQLIDLTIPALGITSPTLSKIQQDCLIMKEAKFVITLGIGGNFCMATAVANTIGYRVDDEPIADMVFNKEYSNAMITKNWTTFINKLKEYGE